MAAANCESLSTTETEVSVAPDTNKQVATKILDTSLAGQERGVYISDDQAFPKDLFAVPAYYKPLIDRILIPKGMIVDRIEKMAWDIHQYYTHEHPTTELNLICTLKGAVMFFEHLTQFLRTLGRYEPVCLNRPTYMEHYVKASSYYGMKRRDDVTISYVSRKTGDSEKTLEAFKGKDVVIVEDILESGNTLASLKRALIEAGAKSVNITVLFSKRVAANESFEVEWSGFNVPDYFLLGFGCDLDEHFRDLEHLCIISEKGRQVYLGDS
eukprot:Blabericola_migrator_1__1488@NODE_1394_length_4632_cov_181_340854_g933_i0_p2_GENE_NODE_1394_length_4632_cov_181_340854_g933_i0NODE_1394_length_4632_cov_181_340854_g933_i0_p2_ORF_typecomplete_len269_score40_37Pribosyltran/PF00156_27/9_4e16Pribosyl_synth/PF14572_6/0_00033DUF2808/PF10989_8/0_054_NODE_1394_length_4632_cov_181_340854_g933_i032324038